MDVDAWLKIVGLDEPRIFYGMIVIRNEYEES